MRCTPDPRGSMSDPLARALADMVADNLPPGHPFHKMTTDQRAEICRNAVFYYSLRG